MSEEIEAMRREAMHWATVPMFAFAVFMGHVRVIHSGEHAGCQLCIPRTNGVSLPNYVREAVES